MFSGRPRRTKEQYLDDCVVLRLSCPFCVEHSIDASGVLSGSLCHCAGALPVAFPRSTSCAAGPRGGGRGRRFSTEGIRGWKLELLRSSRSSSLTRIFRALGIAAGAGQKGTVKSKAFVYHRSKS